MPFQYYIKNYCCAVLWFFSNSPSPSFRRLHETVEEISTLPYSQAIVSYLIRSFLRGVEGPKYLGNSWPLHLHKAVCDYSLIMVKKSYVQGCHCVWVFHSILCICRLQTVWTFEPVLGDDQKWDLKNYSSQGGLYMITVLYRENLRANQITL